MAKYEYGDRVIDGKTISISQIPKKLKKTAEWACNCPKCGNPFITVKGEHNEHHFRHKNTEFDRECSPFHVNQTAIHKRAKAVIQEAMKFHLPALTVDRREIDLGDLPPYVIKELPEEYTYREERWIYCEHVEVEHRISTIVPDVVAYTPEGEFLIEIFVTNPVSPTKIAKAEKLGLSLLEVNLSDLKYQPISEDALKKAVIDSCDRTEWRNYSDRTKALEAARAFFLGHKKVKAYRDRQEQLRRQSELAKVRPQENRLTEQKKEPEETKRFAIDLSDLSAEMLEDVKQKMYEDGYNSVKDLDFSMNEQIWDRYDQRWLRCWACGEIKRSDEMVMYQFARGLCSICHYEKGVKPAWK